MEIDNRDISIKRLICVYMLKLKDHLYVTIIILMMTKLSDVFVYKDT